jgi:hypothetical protein
MIQQDCESLRTEVEPDRKLSTPESRTSESSKRRSVIIKTIPWTVVLHHPFFLPWIREKRLIYMHDNLTL